MQDAIQSVIDGTPYVIPNYDMYNEKRSKKLNILQKAEIIIIEGILIFNDENIMKKCDLKLFLDTDDDVRLSRRIYYDVSIRKKNLEDVIDRYLKFIKPAFERYVLPYKKIADMIIPDYGGGYANNKLEAAEHVGY